MMTYMPSEESIGTYNCLLQKWGADKLLENLIQLMSDDLFEAHMNELGEDE